MHVAIALAVVRHGEIGPQHGNVVIMCSNTDGGLGAISLC